MGSADEQTEKVKIKEIGAREYWVGEITAAMKREGRYRKTARDVVQVYEGKAAFDTSSEEEDKESVSFNILYSNTETLLPALYNSTPRPVVQRRFKDADPLGLQAAKALQRVLGFSIDSGDQEYSTFDEVMEQAVLEGAVPGRGVSWVKYDSEFEPVAPKQEGEEPGEKVKYEGICWEQVPWDRFLTGYGKMWKEVPWVGREHLMTAEELKQNFGEKAGKCRLTDPLSNSWSEGQGQKREANETAGAKQVAFVYEIWDKVQKKVFFVSEQYEDGLLKEVEDPLGLTGFFPCPKPLVFVAKVSDQTPIPLYQMYKDQARELNSITTRLKFLIRALKVRGFYNAALQSIENVLAAEDNTLLPNPNAAALEGKSLESAIWLVPIDMIIGVVQGLYLQRQQIKQVIYEITGIADIMRGSSNAAETLGAQEIKTQWGTLRLKRMQKRVMTYVRGMLRIGAEIASKHFSEETFAAMTGLPFPTTQQKQQAQGQLMQLQQQAAQVAMMQQQPVPGQQPQQPQSDPALQQQMEKLQGIVGMPSWGDVLGVLRSDLLRNYRIDIETNSTVDLDATEDKKEIGEFLNALAQLLNGINPAVESGLFTEDVAKKLVMTILRRFRFTDEVEPELLQAGASQQQKKPDPKAEADAAKAQAEMQKLQLEGQLAQQQAQLDAAKMQQEQQKMQMTAEFEREEHAMKMQELVLRGQQMTAKHEQTMAMTAQKVAAAKAMPKTNGVTGG
jgi:hypothetical protein